MVQVVQIVPTTIRITRMEVVVETNPAVTNKTRKAVIKMAPVAIKVTITIGVGVDTAKKMAVTEAQIASLAARCSKIHTTIKVRRIVAGRP